MHSLLRIIERHLSLRSPISMTIITILLEEWLDP